MVGCQNGGFGERSPIFVIFVDFRGLRSKVPCFWRENAKPELLSIFCQNRLFSAGD